MFGESRRVTVLVVLGVLVALLVFGYAIWMLVSERNSSRESAFLTGSETTVYVDPSQYPNWTPPAGSGGTTAGGEDMTPVAPEEGGGGTTPVAPSGSLFPTWFTSKPDDLPSGYTAKDLSPQFRKVRISGVTKVDTARTTTNAPVITIKENIGASDAAVNLTGMRIQSNAQTLLIPRAAKVYKTTGAALTNVTLANGQSAIIIGSTSPVNANFMGNSCMAYLNSRYTFVPKLSGGSCQRPAKNDIATFSGACQDYILRLQSCQEGNPSDSRIPASDSACRTFVSKLNYDGCVDRNQTNANFSTNTWNVWAGKSLVDPLHDRVLLLDANGKLVDYYLY